MSDTWFWEQELRIVWNLIEEKHRIDDIRMKNQAIYIASYVWGKDPDKGKEIDGKIPGIDVPVSANALAGFYM